MIFQCAGVDDREFMNRAVEHCDAVLAREPRRVNEAVHVRVLRVDRPSQCLTGREMPCSCRVGRCADIQTASVSQIEQQQFLVRLCSNACMGPHQDGCQGKRAPCAADKSIANERFGDTRLERERRIQHGVAARPITKSGGRWLNGQGHSRGGKHAMRIGNRNVNQPRLDALARIRAHSSMIT